MNAQIKMFVIKHSLDSSMFKVSLLQLISLYNVLSNLELEGLKDSLIVEVARKFNISNKLAHIDEGKSNELEHLLQETLLVI